MTRAGRAAMTRETVGEHLPAVGVLVALLVAWEIAVRALHIAPYLLPPPSRIAHAFMETRAVLPAHVRTTFAEAALGLGCSAAVGALTAGVLAWSGPVRRALYPIIIVTQNVPLVVMAPLLIVWFGFGIAPKVLVVAIAGYFPIAVATTDALLRADRDLVDLARACGASRTAVVRHVLLPGALPAFFAGLRISATYAVLAAVIAEWVGAGSGLGLYITRAQTAFRVDRVFVAVGLVAALSIGFFAAASLVARLAMPWQQAAVHDPRKES